MCVCECMRVCVCVAHKTDSRQHSKCIWHQQCVYVMRVGREIIRTGPAQHCVYSVVSGALMGYIKTLLIMIYVDFRRQQRERIVYLIYIKHTSVLAQTSLYISILHVEYPQLTWLAFQLKSDQVELLQPFDWLLYLFLLPFCLWSALISTIIVMT